MKILLIEDEEQIANTIIEYLSKGGYHCDWADCLKSGKEKAWNFEYDCLLIDINLPDGDGMEMINFVKSQKSGVGIIIVSAKNAIEDKINGLELGADDYIAKPFDLAELNARIRSVIRRRQFQGEEKLKFNEIEINPFHRVVKVNDENLNLTKKEYELLLYFVSNPNRVIAKETIAERLWGEYSYAADSLDFIYAHLKNIRKKIQEKGGDDYILTVYGLGYKFGVK